MSHRKVISLTTIASLCVACVSADAVAADVAARGGSVTSGFANGNYFNGGFTNGNYFNGGVANGNYFTGGFANRNGGFGNFNGGFANRNAGFANRNASIGSGTFNSLGNSDPSNGVFNTDFPGLGTRCRGC
jgi:hypothetical protein